MKLKGLRDALMFGRVLSAGLVVAGYAFLGVWLSNWLAANGWNIFAAMMAVPVVAAFGMWQGWLFLTRWKKIPPAMTAGGTRKFSMRACISLVRHPA